MSDTIQIDKGEPLRAELTWTDEGGAIDFTGYTLEIMESYPPDLGGAVVITDATQGKASLRIPATAKWGIGRVNWVRIGLFRGGACEDATGRIWVAVQ